MKYIFFVLGFCICLIACNQTQNKNQTLSADSTKIDTLKVTDKVIKDSFPDLETEDRNYQNAKITLSRKEWNQIKKSYGPCKRKIELTLNTPGFDLNTFEGDFNGDGKTDFMDMLTSRFKDTLGVLGTEECIGGCNSYIVFLDSSLPVIKVKNNLGGEIQNVGDLDGDGADEILVYPDWWQSNWNPYKVFSFNLKTKQWNYLIEPVSIFANDMDEQKILIKRSGRKGFVSAYTSASDEDGNIKSQFKDFKIIKQ